jgi:lipopolysaccharide export system permease protein
MMHFLWQFVDEMVGKGISMDVIAKLFSYAAMTFVPQAMPLAILFASLMTFGNLGEQSELMAMKSAGISLIRIMRPLTVFLVFVAISAFFFQNNIIPVSQVRFYTILYSVKQKSPELAIPEGVFNTEINGKNIYVKKKDNRNKLLKDVMIYDYSDGFNNARVIVADSGRLKTSSDKKFLIMTLYSGESFENVKGNKNRVKDAKDAVPYRRETFDFMEMLIEFDENFNMRDESLYQGRYIGKNITSLQRSIDSMTVRIDSIKMLESKALFAKSYRKTLARYESAPKPQEQPDSVKNSVLNFDSLYKTQEANIKASLLSYSKRSIENFKMDYGYKNETLKSESGEIRRHHTEMHKKFTLSIACLVFFFIGAPLGAIIRKGGLGAPAVISVFLFLAYYVIDTIGYKLAREGVWPPWQGMWLSSSVLLPLGVFLTYKAVNDSVIMNAETYLDALKRLVGKRESRVIEKKDIIMETPDYGAVETSLTELKLSCLTYLSNNKRWFHYFQFWRQSGVDREAARIALEVESIVEILKNSDNNLVLNKTMDFPIINNYRLIDRQISPGAGMALALLFPVGGFVYLIAIYRRKLLRQDMNTAMRICDEMTEIINDKYYARN